MKITYFAVISVAIGLFVGLIVLVDSQANHSPPPDQNIDASQQACSEISSLPNLLIETIVSEYDPSFSVVSSGVAAVQTLDALVQNGDASFSTNFNPPKNCTINVIVNGIYEDNSYQANISALIDPLMFKNDQYCQAKDMTVTECVSETGVFLNLPN